MEEKKFVTKDSGQRQEFETGSRRDLATGKGRFDLIPTLPLRRLAGLYERGAAKYGDRNWEKGQPLMRYIDSAMRHLNCLLAGEPEEDHATAVAWNMFSFIFTQDAIERGRMPRALDDRPPVEGIYEHTDGALLTETPEQLQLHLEVTHTADPDSFIASIQKAFGMQHFTEALGKAFEEAANGERPAPTGEPEPLPPAPEAPFTFPQYGYGEAEEGCPPLEAASYFCGRCGAHKSAHPGSLRPNGHPCESFRAWEFWNTEGVKRSGIDYSKPCYEQLPMARPIEGSDWCGNCSHHKIAHGPACPPEVEGGAGGRFRAWLT